ncbi:hypothetical protein Rhe02_82060 [Rhizocola hellebori]|uniref:Terpene synthase n=1 Tax=Rhizocola hellebori TaxID=1392758 RepID=A0A8J3QFR1_9ACTN|nr:terpene synthase family protein [Rhizocola hellebori]GIH10139.1 hypothetical protein Rhe02_82060 [Rhizocola hellebori]
MTIHLGSLEAIEGLDAPCRRHPFEPRLHDALAPDSGARFAAMASRALPESDLATAVLFGQWIGWFADFDDQRDDGPLGSDTARLNRRYRDLLATVDRSPTQRYPRGGDEAFAGLWRQTAPRVGPQWTHRFRIGLREHWRGSLIEAANRQSSRVPTPAEFVQLRRITNGAMVLLLPEAMLRVDVPWRLAQSPAWRALVDACNDVVGWCNDLASVQRESARGDIHNFVLVIAHALGVSRASAAARVRERIARRMLDMHHAARFLPSTFDSLGLDRRTACDVSRVAVTFLATPRGHLEWLRESSRYAQKAA